MKHPEILYQDAAVLVAVKPVGCASETELPALLAEQTGGDVFCVHRLDTAVGGVMVCARTKCAAAALSKAIAEGRLEKRYLAVCAGTPEPERGELRDLLFHDARKNRSFPVSRPRKGVREAVLRYRVLAAGTDCSLVLVALETGRSHQIRVQFAARKHPLLGDGKYGSRVKSSAIALWSHALSFPHPEAGERLRFSVSPPEEFPWMQFKMIGGLTADAEL